MNQNERKQQFSFAYIHAVATAADLTMDETDVDIDSVDLEVKGKGFGEPISSPTIGMQVKCTSAHQPRDGVLSFPLPVKNYNELRWKDEAMTPRILVVVVVPENEGDWLEQNEDSLIRKPSAKPRGPRGVYG